METRKLSEILQIVLDAVNAKKYLWRSGICYLLTKLRYDGIISFDECFVALAFIKRAKPKSRHLRDNPNSSYHFKPCDWTSRKRYLRHHIKKLKENRM